MRGASILGLAAVMAFLFPFFVLWELSEAIFNLGRRTARIPEAIFNLGRRTARRHPLFGRKTRRIVPETPEPPRATVEHSRPEVLPPPAVLYRAPGTSRSWYNTLTRWPADS